MSAPKLMHLCRTSRHVKFSATDRVQGYLAYKKTHPPRTLPQAYCSSGGGRFLMGEIPLYQPRRPELANELANFRAENDVNISRGGTRFPSVFLVNVVKNQIMPPTVFRARSSSTFLIPGTCHRLFSELPLLMSEVQKLLANDSV